MQPSLLGNAWAKGLSMSVVMIAAASDNAQSKTWESVAPMPTPAAGFACGIVEGELVVAGGTTWEGGTKRWMAELTRYRPGEDRWTHGVALPAPLGYPAFAQTADGLYVAGGTDDQQVSDKVARLTPEGNLEPVATLPMPRIYGVAVASGDHVYLVGGGTDAADLTRLTDSFLQIDTKVGGVRSLQPLPGDPRMLPAAAAMADGVFVFGGARFDADRREVVNLNAAVAYSFADQRWRPIAQMPVALRGATACALTDEWVLIAGGFGGADPTVAGSKGDFSATTFLYSVSTNRYHRAEPLPLAVMGVGLLKLDEDLYVFGGEDQTKHRSARVFRRPWRDLIPVLPATLRGE